MEERGSMLLTETAYEPGMHLPRHSHASNHLAILLSGAYLERTGRRTYLCLPGDAVHYSRDVVHDNQFGRRRGVCLNLEFDVDREPEACKSDRTYVPSEIRSLTANNGTLDPKDTSGWAASARQIIDKNPSCRLSIVSDRLAVHPGHLAKCFRRAFGLSVGQYARLQRMRHAARLLIDTDDSLAEVAYDTGFFDQSHLTNSFQQIAGFSPAELRRLTRN